MTREKETKKKNWFVLVGFVLGFVICSLLLSGCSTNDLEIQDGWDEKDIGVENNCDEDEIVAGLQRKICKPFSDGPSFCDDGNACTTGYCVEDGYCESMPIDCDDDDLCTVDYCDPNMGCVHTPLKSTCDTGNPCLTDWHNTAIEQCVSTAKVVDAPQFCQGGCIATEAKCLEYGFMWWKNDHMCPPGNTDCEQKCSWLINNVNHGLINTWNVCFLQWQTRNPAQSCRCRSPLFIKGCEGGVFDFGWLCVEAIPQKCL